MKKLPSILVLLAFGFTLGSADPWCVPGWKASCNNRGTCNPTTNTCQCDKLPLRCGSQTNFTHVFDPTDHCATVTHGCFYELTPGGEVSQHLCNNRGCCHSQGQGQPGSGQHHADYNCHCEMGFMGKDCEKKDPCYHSVPGVNELFKRNCSGSDHGTCRPDPMNDTRSFCECKMGYFGVECENDDEPIMQARSLPQSQDPNHPCVEKNNHPEKPDRFKNCSGRGTCIKTPTDSKNDLPFLCVCQYGFWGTECQYRDLCKITQGSGETRKNNKPCNGGACRNISWGSTYKQAHNSFTCECGVGKVGKCCEFMDPCTFTPCLNGASCSFNQTNDIPPVQKCRCKYGFHGDRCDKRNPCSVQERVGEIARKRRDCNKRGQCTETKDRKDFVCKCKQGYWGKECEFVNLCIVDENGNLRPPKQPCGGGTCRNESSGFPWWPRDNYTCIYPDPCKATPCKNGGKCIKKPVKPGQEPTRTCTCLNGYIDDDCGVVNPCYVPKPGGKPQELVKRDCNKRGNCVVTGSATKPTYTCNCTYGFWHTDCHYTDLCKISETGTIRPPDQPCSGFGSCRNQSTGSLSEPPVNTFKCECCCNRTGQFCQFPNPCKPDACKNGGSCSFNQTDPDKLPTRNCLCKEGYIGNDCEVVSPCYLPPKPGSDPKDKRDCNNRGTCMVIENGTNFECNCSSVSEGYWGKECNFTDLCKVDMNGTARPPHQPCNGGTCRNESMLVDGKVNDAFTCQCPNEKLGDLCQFPNPCSGTPCQNGGTCTINQTAPDQPPTKNCSCRNGFMGESCNQTNPCYVATANASDTMVRRDCNGRGECMIAGNGTSFICNCTQGYSWGPECEFTDLCKVDINGTAQPPGQPCNGGICRNESTVVNGKVNDTFKCDCPNETLGERCEFTNPCLLMPCLNGGTCIINDTETPPSRTCACPEGYIREDCELVNPCFVDQPNTANKLVPRDCNNRGECNATEDHNDFNCLCKFGYWGKECNFTDLCKVDMNGTARPSDKPCNGGTCRNESMLVDGKVNDTFTCHCPNETLGDICQFPNPCSGTPCQNGGTCTINQTALDQLPTKSCSCLNGFIGESCNQTNPCYVDSANASDTMVPRDCNGRGECMIAGNGTSFVCNCTQGYSWGPECEFTDLCKVDMNGTAQPPDICYGGICRNASTMVNGKVNDTFKCDCPNETLGERCEFTNPCLLMPCLNGATCILNETVAPPIRTCACSKNYIGDDCEVLNPCYKEARNSSDLIPRDCNKRGECMITGNLPDVAYFCNCTRSYYWGQECEFTDLCKGDMNGTARPPDQPCNNGGICRNESIVSVSGKVNDTFKCDCSNETVGEFCQFPNPCFTSPCLNGATCILNETVAPPSKTCQCQQEYIGDNCEVVHPCFTYKESNNSSQLVPRDCNKRGQCMITGSLPNVTYDCNCTTGYWFTDCAYIDLCKVDENGAPRPPNQPCYGDICRNHSFGSVFGPTNNSFTCECFCNRTGRYCQFPNPCRPNPCINGGNCTLNQTDPDKPPTRNCVCPKEYIGHDCELVNPCYVSAASGGDNNLIPRDCNNRGECSITSNGTDFVCVNCTYGYWGKECNFTDLCKVDMNGTVRPPDQPCNNGGTCRNQSIVVDGKVNNTFKCDCSNETVGDLCQFPNPCSGMACQNGGTCTINQTAPDQPPTKNCSCLNGFMGESCNQTNPCYVDTVNASHPIPRDCNGRGECMIAGNGTSFVCNCTQRYSWGPECEFTDLCKVDMNGTAQPPGQPCNGGICRNESTMVNGKVNDTFTCQCSNETLGERCELTNPCFMMPCLNGGTCIINITDTPPTRTCSCPNEYIGNDCELVNPCYVSANSGGDKILIPRDCNNRGECSITSNGTDFSCVNCTYGYFGKECNLIDLCKVDQNGTVRPPDQPCNNGGTCRNESIVVNGKVNNTFKCNCSNETVGDLCQFPNPCSGMACQNGGTCTINQTAPDQPPTKNCSCLNGFMGESCNQTNPCYVDTVNTSHPIPRDCNGRGECMIAGNGTSFVCNCTQGYSWGPECEFTDLCKGDMNGTAQLPDICNGGICRNESTMVNGKVNDTFKCACPNETLGERCELTNPCFMMPCLNGGLCIINLTDTPPTRTCSCPKEYIGKDCELVNPCYVGSPNASVELIPRDCNNRGLCSIISNGTDFACINCSYGYFGKECNLIDLCKVDQNGTVRPPNQPCNGGTCRNESTMVNGKLNDAFKCNCSNETVGDQCQFPNPCSGTPCKNGGTCTINQTAPDQPPTKNCSCLNGFMGESCNQTNPCYVASANASDLMAPRDCNGRGECMIAGNGTSFVCNCTESYHWGPECEFTDLCKVDMNRTARPPDQPCNNGGICRNESTASVSGKVNDTFKCDCSNGTVGEFCQFPNPCFTSPCLNGAACILNETVAPPSKTCQCQQEYIGDNCEVVHPCFTYKESNNSSQLVPRDCNKRGQCMITGSLPNVTYDCNCTTGYWFTDCAYIDLCKVDETGAPRPPNHPCYGDICRNHSFGSVFGPANNSFTCECFCNRTGRYCQFPNPCRPNPCINGGNCTLNQTNPDKPPTRNCACPKEYIGHDCELVNPCYVSANSGGDNNLIPRDCNGRGECSITSNGTDFACVNCTYGYFGKECNLIDLCKVDQNGTVRPPNQPCNGGTCRNESTMVDGKLNDTFTCQCPNETMGERCEVTNPCFMMPCLNGGTCIINTTETPPTRTCSCPKEYIGNDCEVVNPCYVGSPNASMELVPRDCNNGGECSIAANGTDFVCVNCTYGYWGKECNLVDLCKVDMNGTIRPPDQPCNNGGICRNESIVVNGRVNDTFKCDCANGTVGEFCQYPNPCFTTPCLNGAACTLNETVAPPTSTCQCLKEYIGKNCEVVNPCYKEAQNSSDLAPRDCNGRGECMIAGNRTSFICNCTQGYSWGPECEFTDLCKVDMNGTAQPPGQPCNGGICRNASTMVNGKVNDTFKCNCPNETLGERCELTNPCFMMPCLNGGTCIINITETPPTRTCSCPNEYIGNDCEVVNPCYVPAPTGEDNNLIPRDCNNRGECSITSNGTDFVCVNCSYGYFGKECNLIDLCKVDQNGTVRPPDQPCNNGGICRNGSIVVDGKVNNTFKCDCANETVGDLCQFPNPCSGTPCQNGGTCTINQTAPDQPPTKNCSCLNGFMGESCNQTNPCYVASANASDLMAPRDCNGRGGCMIAGNGTSFVCNCTESYHWGPECEFTDLCKVDMNETAQPPGQPCNGGICRNESSVVNGKVNDTFMCQCSNETLGERCELTNPCFMMPCLNGGMCIINLTDTPPTRTCSCPNEYIGNDCELVNPCYVSANSGGDNNLIPRDCNNRGECSITLNGTDFACVNCTYGYWGKECNYTDLCKVDMNGTARPPDQPCNNGGICRNESIVSVSGKVNDTFKCDCANETLGASCQFPNPCFTMPCLNGATCILNETVAPPIRSCQCEKGYIGDNCAVVNPCYKESHNSSDLIPRDCNKRGECIITGSLPSVSYTCNCTGSYYFGPECEFKDLCKVDMNGTAQPPGQPCNGGICINESLVVSGKVNDTFKCKCSNETVGEFCQFPNPCFTTPCLNGASCILNGTVAPPTRTCQCEKGYIGDNCGVVNPCYKEAHDSSDLIPRDCNKRGECMITGNLPNVAYTCRCKKDYYWGPECEFIDLCKGDMNGTAQPPGQPCNSGTCRNESTLVNGKVNDTFKCDCSNEKVGRRCEFTNPCTSMPCKHGGTCIINQTDPYKPPTFNCLCPTGFITATCCVISPCYVTSPSGGLIPRDCNGRGQCNITANQNDFECRCRHGFWEKECGFIDLCKIDADGNMRAPDKPCNGGTCKNQSRAIHTSEGKAVENTFICHCPPNKLGKYCEFVNPCTVSPCLNGGTCLVSQLTPESAPTRTCHCAEGYFGDRCEQINPCYFNSTYCKNSANCIREDNYTMSCNCTRPYFQGSQCATINLCNAPPECEVFNGGMEYCNPCKNGGKCTENSTDPTNIIYSCNCNGTGHGGEFCEHVLGKLLIIPQDYGDIPTSEHVDSFVAISGYPHVYYIVALLIGDDPEMDFFTGDGFSMKLQPKLFRPVDRNIPALAGIAVPGTNLRSKRDLSNSRDNTNVDPMKDAVYYPFQYTYSTCPEDCKMTAALRNLGVLSSVRVTKIRVLPPTGIPCVPNTGLRNVGHVVNDAPEYKRTSRFVVEANLKFECFEDNWLDPLLDPSIQLSFKWSLYRLSYFFPSPSAENDWHVEKLTPATEKYLVFEPHVLVEGFYWVECRAFVRIGDKEYGNSQLGFFKILLNPPRIVLKESTTRYVDGDQDIIIDASESVDDSFPEHSPYLKFSWTCEPPCSVGPWEGETLRIPAKTFRVGDVIKIRLNVRSNHAETSATETITLHIGSEKKMSVRCIRNCEKFNPGDEVVFECAYEINGIRQPANDTVLEWLPAGELIPTFNVIEEPHMTSVMLPIVNDPAPRAIICTGARFGSSAVSARMEFRINMPPTLPSGGACFIAPFANPKERGVYLVTRFKIECNTRFIDPHVPLRYSFYAQSEDTALSRLLGDRILLNYDTNPKTEEVFLPLGSWNQSPFASWRMKIIVKVTDDLGLSTELSGYTFVEPPDTTMFTYLKLFKNLIFGEKSLMRRRFLTGDNQGVLQLQTVAAYGANRPAIMNTLTDTEQFKFLSAMEHTLIRVPLHSFKLTEQKITAAHFIDHVENRPASEVLTEVSQIMFESASQMVEYAKQGEEVMSQVQVDTLSRASADSSSRLLRASHSLGTHSSLVQPNFQMVNKRDVFDYDIKDDTGRDYFFEVHDIEDDFGEEGFDEISENVVNEDIMKYAKVAHHTLFAFERVMDAAVENLGYQTKFITKTDKMGLHAEVLAEIVSDYVVNVQAADLDGTKTAIMIPKNLHAVLKDKVENDLELQITEVTINPYYDDSSANPHTPVINLVLKDSESHVPVLLEDLPYPLNITLPFQLPPANSLDGARTAHEVDILPVANINEDTELLIFKLDLPYDTTVQIEIDNVTSPTMIFKIIALKDSTPTLHSLCTNPSLEVTSLWPGSFRANFSTESLGFHETPDEPYLEYYIGILVVDPNAASTRQRFRILFTRLACLHRDEDRKFWSEDGCVVDLEAVKNADTPLLHCRCRHASILTGVQFIAPHYLETVNILDFTLEEFQRNPVVLATVCTMLALYLIGLILCRVFDNRDRDKNLGLTIMADLRESGESRFYLITIVTGCNFWAGTTSAVSIIIYGTSGRSKTYTLKDESLNVFRRGGVDTFLVSSDKDLGTLEKIRIWTDFSGSDPAWFCRRILIRPLGENETIKWYFYIHKWFTITAKSATIIQEVPATTRPERKLFSARFRENFMEQIDNVNLWFSIFRYSPAFTFTRCQRFSCAFAVLSSYLLINIMFYGMLTEDENGFYEVGEYAFDVYTVIKNFQTVLLSLPFGTLIIILFRYILARYIPTLIIWKNVIPAKLSLDNKNMFIPQTDDDDDIKKFQDASPANKDKISNVMIEFDSDEEDVPFPETVMTGVQRKSFDATSDTSSKSNFSIPSTDIPQLEEWLEGRTKQHRGYTAKLVGAGSDESEDQEEYPDKFINSLDTKDEENRHADNLNRLGRLAMIHSVRDYDPDTFIFQGENDIPQIEALIDEQLKWRGGWKKERKEKDENPESIPVVGTEPRETVIDPKTKPEFKKVKNTPWKETITTEYLQKIDKILDEEVETKHKMQDRRNWKQRIALEICLLPPVDTPRCSWPYWFLIVAWLVCLLTIVLTCYFTLLYGLHYGYLRSINWLQSYIRSFFISVFIVQPLTAVISSFLATLCGKDQKVSERVQVLVEDSQTNSTFLDSRLPYKFTIFQATLGHQPLSGTNIFRLTIDARRKHEIRDKLFRLILCLLLLFPLILVSYSGHNQFDYDITENVRNMLSLNNVGEMRKQFQNEEAVYQYMEKVLLPNLHPEKWYNGRLIPQPTPIKDDAPAILADHQTFLIGVGRVRQQRVKSSTCIEHDQIAIGPNFRCNAEYKKSSQDRESYNPAWDPVTGSRLPSSLTNDGWEFHGKDSKKTLSLGYTGYQGHYDGGGYILELGRSHRESESIIKFMRTHHWLDHRTRAIFIELTLMNPNINKFVDVVLLIEQSATWAYTMKSWISPITLIPIEDLQESNALIWVAINILVIVSILIVLFCIFMIEAYSTPNFRWVTSLRFWFDMTIITLALTSLGISVARFVSAKKVSDVIESQRIDEYVSIQRAAWWYDVEKIVFSITQTVVFIKIWKLIMFTDRRFLSFALTLKLTAGFLLGFLLILSIFIFAFAFAGHFLFGQDLWEFSTLKESMITLVDQILGVSLFDEFAQANPVMGPVYAFLFGFLVVFIGLNFVVALLDLGVHEAKEVVLQRKIWLTYTNYFIQTMKKSFPIFERRFRKEHADSAEVPMQIPPERMQGMKDATAAYLREFLGTTRDKMNEMETHCNRLLAGTGYRMVNKQEKAKRKELEKQQHIDQMRTGTSIYIKEKIGYDMNPEEMKSYADFNKEIVKLRIQKMEKKMEELVIKVDQLVDSFT